MESRIKFYERWLMVLFYILGGVYVVWRGAEYLPDSSYYLNMAFNHSPVYALFSHGFQVVFGDYFEWPLILVQYILIVLAIELLVRNLSRSFGLRTLSSVVFKLVLIAPVFYLHFIANRILTEALAYPLVLMLLHFAWKAIRQFDVTAFVKAVIVLYLLCSIRGQFLGLLPVLVLLGLYLLYVQKSSQGIWLALLALLVMPWIQSLFYKTYNYIVHDHFVASQLTNVTMITSWIYVSSESDPPHFDDVESNVLFNRSFTELKRRGLTQEQAISQGFNDYQYFEARFPQICNRVLLDGGLAYYQEKGLDFYQGSIALNDRYGAMFSSIVKHNYKRWGPLFLKNLSNAFGSSKLLLLVILIGLYALYGWIKSPSDYLYRFIVLITGLMLCNHLTVAISAHSIKRYLFYFDWVLIVIFILLVESMFNRKTDVS